MTKVTTTIHAFKRMLVDKKGHNELGLAPYMVLVSIAGFIMMRVKLFWRKRKGLTKG